MIPVTITLPYPPTANNLYRNVAKGRVKSSGYLAWLAEAAQMIAIQRPAKVAGAYRLSIVATRPDRRARDIDNLIKPISDALKKGGVIEDDSLAQRVMACWSRNGPTKGADVLVRVDPDVVEV